MPAAPSARLCFGHQASDTHSICLCTFGPAGCLLKMEMLQLRSCACPYMS